MFLDIDSKMGVLKEDSDKYIALKWAIIKYMSTEPDDKAIFSTLLDKEINLLSDINNRRERLDL